MAVQRMSNAQFAAGGLYPGGQGIISDIYYKVWDYNGKATSPNLCVEMIFTPTDGSNEGKPVTINWNIGEASDKQSRIVQQPDPKDNAFYVSETGKKLNDNSTWHFAMDTGFVRNCGLDPTALDGPKGIKVLIGSDLTLARMDPPKRSFQEAAPIPGQSEQQAKQGNQVLVPTRCKFKFESKGAGTSAGTAATTNGASNGTAHSGDLAGYMKAILADNDDALDMSEFTAKLLVKLGDAGIKGKERLSLTKQTKDAAAIQAIAAANNWTLEDFSINSDGSMEGTLSGS